MVSPSPFPLVKVPIPDIASGYKPDNNTSSMTDILMDGNKYVFILFIY
jgi:hypothetical protein